jgi:hypothetical protein
VTVEAFGSDVGPFSIVPAWLLDADVSDRAVRLYAVLGRYANSEGEGAFPSRRTLAKRLNVKARSTVDLALTELRKIGALEWTHRTRDDGGWSSNEYVLHHARPLTTQPVTPDRAVSQGADRDVGHLNDNQEETISLTDLDHLWN